MDKFNNLSECEMQEVNGGANNLSFESICVVIDLVFSGYSLLRDMVREMGRDAAYRDLGY